MACPVTIDNVRCVTSQVLRLTPLQSMQRGNAETIMLEHAEMAQSMSDCNEQYVQLSADKSLQLTK